uniref:Protein YIF1 n=2 Tax=Meloidogyne TaxID=189290 RepID=A0A915PC81_9BILA
MTTPHYFDQNKNLNSPNPFDSQQHLFDGQHQQQANFDYYTQQQPQYDPHFNYSSNIPPSDTSQQQQSFNQQFMYDPFVNTARHLGGQFAEQQKQKITQYISTFNLKYYFAVDVNYVRRKLLIILFPFLHRDWTNKLSTNDKPMTPREDINAPDLYIPSMAFITYILVAGIVFGVQQRFTPEKLGMLTTNALFYMIFENLIVFLMKYALNISQSLNVWHALAYSSYKFTSMVVCLLLYLIGGRKVYYFVLVYCILATVFFLLRSLKTFILDMGWSPNSGRKRKIYLLLAITAFQSLIMWLLTSSVTSYMPGKYDFAKMAMSGMGLSNTNKEVPLMSDGEVDYEALLKMP